MIVFFLGDIIIAWTSRTKHFLQNFIQLGEVQNVSGGNQNNVSNQINSCKSDSHNPQPVISKNYVKKLFS